MRIAGIICEYNPFHNGHAHQLAVLREAGYAPVCVMSGDYVQRARPLSSRRGTGRGCRSLRGGAGARAAAELCAPLGRGLCGRRRGAARPPRLRGGAGASGSESGDAEALLATARTLLSPELVPLLKQELAGGASFPAARQRALERLGAPGAALLERPNSILAVEYCKALLRRGSAMRPLVLHRAGDYHGGSAADAPSASFLRGQADWAGYMPEAARAVQAAAPRYRLAAGSGHACAPAGHGGGRVRRAAVRL